MKRVARPIYLALAVALVVALGIALSLGPGGPVGHLQTAAAAGTDNSDNTTTPIKHVVVIFQENETFDHYFGTYPYASNTDGTDFCPAAGTPGLPGASETVNSMLAAGDLPGSTLGAPITNGNCAAYAGATPNPNAGGQALIARDPNAVGTAGTSSSPNDSPNPNEYPPQRIPDTVDFTCGNNHGYTNEQNAEDNGKMNDFIQDTSSSCQIPGVPSSDPGIGMDYYDGNSVTALWNYAQNYAMSDNSWDAGFGPSFPGYVNSFGASTYSSIMGESLTNDSNPEWDIDPEGWESSGNNIGDLLNGKSVTWGSFGGGFDEPTQTATTLFGDTETEYSPGLDPEQFWQDTSNAAHTPPASPSEVGLAGQANHNYDLTDFDDALNNTGGATLPAVSIVRPSQTQDAHPESSGILDEQQFLTSTINKIEQSAYWPSTAIVIEYDDSDGWYDHQSPTENIYNADGTLSSSPSTNDIIYDASTTGSDGTVCSSAAAQAAATANDSGSSVASSITGGEIAGESQRCGPSQRLPFVVISPYAKQNYVDHTLTTQDSVLRFIEQNWSLPTLGSDTFDNLPQVGNLDSFFDWEHPQQNEVILDQTCNVSGLAVVSDTCNNTTANATTDGVTDLGFGALQSTPAVANQIPAAPVLSAQHATISVPLSLKGTLSPATVLQEAGVTASAGTPAADTSAVNLAKAGVYTASVAATEDYTYDGMAQDIESVNPVTVTVDVVPAINVPSTTLTYDTSSDPTAQKILSDSGATIDGGSLDPPTIPSGDDLSEPGSYQIEITGSAGGQEATPVTVTVDVIADPRIALQNTTVDYPVGASPTGAQVLSDAGAQINDGTLANPDLSAVNFGQAGSYTVTVRGGDDGFAAPPATLTIDVVKAPVITLGQASVAYVIGSSPAASQILQAARVSASEGTPSLDLSGSVTGDQKVDFSQAGSYPVSVTDTYDGASAQPMTFDVDVIQQPVVTLRSSRIDVAVGRTLSSEQVLTDAGAAVSQGGTLAAAVLSGVNFHKPGRYPVSVGGSVDGIKATPAKLTIKVLARPTIRLAKRRLSYPVGAKVGAAAVLRASRAKVSDSGTASVNLSTVKFAKAGHYSVQITGAASGMAATPAALDITVQPVVSVTHARIAFPVGTKLTAKAVLRAAGAKTSAGSVVTPSLSHVDLHEAGDYKLKLTSKANGVSSKPKTITIVVKRKL